MSEQNELFKETVMPAETANDRFAANLASLRKNRGLSQEQLAEKLGVSRQSISKWESSVCLPELSTLDALCELFGCTLDALLRGSVEQQSLAAADAWDKGWNAFACRCTVGVTAILAGITTTVYLFAAHMAEEWQVLATFLGIICGVVVFIVSGIQFDAFEKKNQAVDVFYPPERVDAFNQRFAWLVAIPVGMILAGIAAAGLLENILGEDLSGALFMTVLTMAVAVLVWSGMQKGKYEEPDHARRKRDDPAYARREELFGKCMAVLWITISLLYVLWGITRTGNEGWKNGWPIFIVGGMLTAIIAVVLEKEDSNK